MGFIRGILFIFVSVLLFLSLFSAGFFYMVSLSLEPEVVKSNLVNSTDILMREIGVYNNFVEGFPLMQNVCSVSETYNFKISSGEFEIPCENIDAGVDEVYYSVLGDFVMRSYYENYDCSILKCLEETKSPSFLISLKTKNYASNKFYFLILASFILIGLMFFLIETKSNLPFVVGAFLIVLSLPFLKLDSALSFFADKTVLNFLSIFVTKTYTVFARFLFFGILLILVGIIWKMFLIGFKINNIINWFKDWKKNRDREKVEKEKKLSKTKSK